MIRLKKMLALAIAMVMAIGAMNVGAFAATGNVTADPTIVVSGLETGDIAHFYRVIEWEMSDATHDGGWIFTPPFSGMTHEGGAAVTVKEITGDPSDQTPVGLTSEMAGIIARKANPNNAIVVPADKNGNASLTIDGTNYKPGLYLVLITPADADTVYNPIFVSSDYKADNPSASWTIRTSELTYFDEAAAKRSKLNVTKVAGTEMDPQQTAEIGKLMNYTVNTTIPAYGLVYTDPHFVIHDQLTNMVLEGDITVKADGTELEKGADKDYTLDKGNDNFTITFTEAYLTQTAAPRAIEVTYTARVTTDAVTFISEEDNEIHIEYSHNPHDGSDFNVKKDTTEHYTFTIGADALSDDGTIIKKSTTEVVKVGIDAAGNPISETTTTSQITGSASQQGPLEGAHFKVYTDPECTKEYEPKNADGTPVDPIPEIVSREDGRLTVKNLAAGTYYFKEVSAPEGYVKDTTTHSVEIRPTFKENEVTEYYDFGDHKWYPEQNADNTRKEAKYKTHEIETVTVIFDGNENDPAAVHTFSHNSNSIHVSWEEGESRELPSSIVNTQGVELPATGGIGTTIFYAIGTILVLGAGILLVTRRRMETR